MVRRFLVTAGASLCLAAAASAGAMASPITFTWDPSAPPIGTCTAATCSNIVADNMVVTDVAGVTIPGGPTGGAFTETAILPIGLFELPPGTIITPQPSGYGSTYSLYFTATLAGTQGPIPTKVGTASVISFTTGSSYSFTLWATPNPTISAKATSGTVAITSKDTGAFPVATGTLTSGSGTLLLTSSGYSPSVSLVFTFDPCSGAGTGAGGVCTGNETSFFVSPSFTAKLNLFGTFTADPTVVSVTSGPPGYVDINGGGGNLTLSAIPEPASILALGVGLLGLGFVKRRSRYS
jgi:PEP-CTERM motif